MTLSARLVRRSTAAVLLAAVACSLAGLATEYITVIPASLRFLLAVLAMAFAPGYGILHLTRAWRPDALTNLALVFVLSLSVNLLLNVAVMLAGSALATALVPYMVVTGAFVAFGLWRHDGNSDRDAMHVSWLDAALIAGVAIMLVQIYQVGPPNVGAEELVIVNRLATNPSVHYNNVNFQQGMPATYLLVPHQQLLASVALMSRLEPAVVQSLFWTVTAAIGSASLAALAMACVGSPSAIPLTIGVLIAIGLFEPEALTYQFGFGIPFPNRYGIAPGVLLPLILLFFWQQLQAGSLRGVQLFVLVYLILEITFVHAREAICALSGIILIGAFAAERGRVKTTLIVTVSTILISVAALLTYRWLTLTFSTDLNAYVQNMRTVIWSALREFWREQSLTDLLWLPASNIEVGATVVQAPSYRAVVEPIWSLESGRYTSRILFPLTFLALPVAMLWARTRLQLAMGCLVAIWGLLLHSGALTLLVSYAIGNPEALSVTSLLGLLLFCCAIALLANVSDALTRLAAGQRGRVAAIAIVLVLATSVIATARFDLYKPLAVWLQSILKFPTPAVLHVLTLLAAAWKMRALAREAGPRPVNAADDLSPALATVVALAVAFPIGIRAWSGHLDLIRRPTTSGQVTGRSADDYRLLRREGRIYCALPFDVIVYLRRATPGQNVIGQDTHCVALVTPHYVATNGYSGQALSPSSIVNLRFSQLFPETIGRDPRSKDLPMYTLAAFDTRERWQRLVSSMNIDLVIVEPKEQDAAQRLIASFAPGDPERPETLWTHDGYSVLQTGR